MYKSTALLLGFTLTLTALAGCASKEAWVIVSVRDKLDRTPIAQPVITVTPRHNATNTPGGDLSQQANAFGTARMKLATGQLKYQVTIDAPQYDLFTFDLPNLDAFFPSGQWLKGENSRKYQLRPDHELELMVTLEPTGE